MDEDLFGSRPRSRETPRGVMTVSELTARIKDCLEGSFRLVRVEGEVSNHRVYPSGHRYFSLKDGGAQIRVVLFRARERFIFGDLRDGQTAVVTGPVGVYEARGEYQLYAQTVEIGGLGPCSSRSRNGRRRWPRRGSSIPRGSGPCLRSRTGSPS